MKTMSHWGKPVALFAIGLSVVGSLQTPASAVPSFAIASSIEKSNPASLLAQDTPAQPAAAPGSLVGQCRAAKQRIFVYSQRSTSSQTLRTLAVNEQVTLADNGSGGWIAISAPVTGYVQAANLKLCQGQTTPPDETTSNLCRVANVGLVI
ncbi:MAG: SH3 domain-containing protein, partial [Coleofasciculus sp. S288]|nr:SH3 domain-containing protein [Coleofasciculus sp. S288]